jgi:hypothetical protein
MTTCKKKNDIVFLECANAKNVQKKDEIKEKDAGKNICNLCSKTFARKSAYTAHTKLCSKTKEEYIKELKNCKIELSRKIKDHDQAILQLSIKTKELETITNLYNELKIKYDKTDNDYRDLVNNTTNSIKTIEQLASKAIENAGTKIVNNTSNNIQTLYQNLKPITDDHLRQQSKYLERQHIRNGADSIAYFANEYSYKDRVVCTDVARRTFLFKDENGTVVKDPKGVQITRKFIENNKDELVKLLEEYSELYYEDVNRTWFTYEKKCKRDECLYAIKRGEKGSNMNYYNTFLKVFTSVLGRLTYNKKDERLEMPLASEIASEEMNESCEMIEEITDSSDECDEKMSFEELTKGMLNPFER